MDDEHGPSLKLARTPLDETDARVSVLQGRREFSCLVGCAHALVLGWGNPSLKYERLCPTTHSAEQRADDDVVGRWRQEGLGADFPTAGRCDPERACGL